MIFFGNLIFSIIISYAFGKRFEKEQLSDGALFFLFLFFGVVWIIITGGQYYVGTDYPTYIHIFNGNGIELYQQKGELLFYYIVLMCNNIGIHGQTLYYLFYTINITVLFLILKRFKPTYYFIFILLYIAYSNIFNNQLNMLRQSIAIHLSTYACILYCENKIRQSLLWISCSFLMHMSTIIMLMIYLLPYLKKIKANGLKIILLLSLLSSFFLTINTFSFITDYLPPAYAAYLNKEVDELSLTVLLTKYIFIPFFWLSISLLKENILSSFERKIFYIGYLGFCFKLLLIKLPIVNRLADYFIILSIFPIFFYIINLKKNNKVALFITFCGIIILFYGLKTILFPKAEYLYNSIYF